MASSRIGVVLDTRANTEGLDQGRMSLTELNSGLELAQKAAGALNTALVEPVKALIGLSNKTAEQASQLAVLSERVGVTTDTLQQFAFAGRVTGVEFDRIVDLFKDLPDRMIEVQRGTQGFKEQFTALGVSAVTSEGALRSTEDVILDIADAVQRLPEQQATGILDALLSDAGTAAIPLLRQGADGIRALTDEAKRMGVVLDSETIRAARDYNSQLKVLEARGEAVEQQIGGALIPALSELAGAFINADGSAQGLATLMRDVLGPAMLFTAKAILGAVGFIAEGIAGILESVTDGLVLAVGLISKLPGASRILAGISDIGGLSFAQTFLDMRNGAQAASESIDTLVQSITASELAQEAGVNRRTGSLIEMLNRERESAGAGGGRVLQQIDFVVEDDEEMRSFLSMREEAILESNDRIIDLALSRALTETEIEQAKADRLEAINRRKDAAITEMDQQVTGLLVQNFTGAMNMLGRAVGDFAITGKFAAKEFGLSMLDMIGQSMVQFGTYLIGSGTGLLALSGGAFPAAIAIGAGLVASGAAISAVTSSLRGGGGGPANPGPISPFDQRQLQDDRSANRVVHINVSTSGSDGDESITESLANIVAAGLGRDLERGGPTRGLLPVGAGT